MDVDTDLAVSGAGDKGAGVVVEVLLPAIAVSWHV